MKFSELIGFCARSLLADAKEIWHEVRDRDGGFRAAMPFPRTWDELIQSGYVWQNDAECRSCGDSVMWFKSPRGKNIPINLMQRGTDPAIAHWATCAAANSFRSK